MGSMKAERKMAHSLKLNYVMSHKSHTGFAYSLRTISKKLHSSHRLVTSVARKARRMESFAIVYGVIYVCFATRLETVAASLRVEFSITLGIV